MTFDVASKFSPVGIILMKKEVHERDDGKVMAIQWEYCMSGDYLASKLYWKDVS